MKLPASKQLFNPSLIHISIEDIANLHSSDSSIHTTNLNAHNKYAEDNNPMIEFSSS